MSHRVLEGDVFDVLPGIAPGSIDCAVTSPPYWKLRAYLPQKHPLKALEIGQEPTPALFVEKIVRVMRLVRDCLADHGVCWLNIGDTYAGGSGGRGDIGNIIKGVQTRTRPVGEGRIKQPSIDTPSGSLCLIPQRLQIALADDGWIVRSVVCWHKPACMPISVSGWQWRRHRIKVKEQGRGQARRNQGTSVTPFSNHSGNKILDRAEYVDCPGCPKCLPNDKLVLRKGSWRPTGAWEPVLMLAKTSGYFSDGEPVKTPAAAATVSRDRYTRVLDDPDEQFAVAHDHETTCDSGANLRDVWRTDLNAMSREELIDLVREMAGNDLPDCWTIGAEPLKAAHYAAYPSDLVRRCLLSSVSAKGYCPGCGKPWVRVVDTARTNPAAPSGWREGGERWTGETVRGVGEGVSSTTLGWRASCKCPPAEPRPGRVLDPFAGSSRTGLTAIRMGLDFTGVELHPDYAALSRRLLSADMPLFQGGPHA